jgi:hypothetical protein
MAKGHARRISLVAITVFFVKVAINPVLQAATGVEQRLALRGTDMKIDIAQHIPDGFLGTWERLGDQGIQIAQGTTQNLSIFTKNEGGYSCAQNGECKGTVSGAGLNYACTTDTRTFDARNARANTTIFSIQSNMTYDFGQPMLHLLTQYISSMSDSCQATLTTDSCYLVPATINYHISIRDSTLTMDPYAFFDKLTMERNYSTAADSEPANDADPLGPLSGLLYGMGPVFRSKAFLSNLSSNKTTFFPTPDPYFSPGWPTLYLNTSALSTLPEECAVQWSSPTRDVLASYFAFMFRSAVAAGRGTSQASVQDFDAILSIPEPRFRTSTGWLVAAALLMTLGLVAALVPNWGFWQLSHHPTLSPLETGKAFGGSILQHAGPEKEGRNIMKEIGHERVAYDGSELIWHGSVYTSGAGSPLVRRMDGFVNTDTAYKRGIDTQKDNNNLSVGQAFGSGRGRGLGHRRGMSSISEAESEEADITTQDIPQASSPIQSKNQSQSLPEKQIPQQTRTRSGSFEHSLGATTRRFDDHFHEHHEANPESRHTHASSRSSTQPSTQPQTPTQTRARSGSTVSISPISAGAQSQYSAGHYSTVSAPSSSTSYYPSAAMTAIAPAPSMSNSKITNYANPPSPQHPPQASHTHPQQIPIILTPGKGGVPHLPPIPPMGNLRMDNVPSSSTHTHTHTGYNAQSRRRGSQDMVTGAGPGGYMVTSPPPPLLSPPVGGGYVPYGYANQGSYGGGGGGGGVGYGSSNPNPSPAVERAMKRQLSLIDEISRQTPT